MDIDVIPSLNLGYERNLVNRRRIESINKGDQGTRIIESAQLLTKTLISS